MARHRRRLRVKFINVVRVMEDTQLKRAAAYSLMNALGAVRFGRSIRLPEKLWLRYTAAKARASLATLATTDLRQHGLDELEELPDDAPSARHLPPPTAEEDEWKRQQRIRLDKAAERARRLSEPPSTISSESDAKSKLACKLAKAVARAERLSAERLRAARPSRTKLST
jgi:hypothetical protein